MKRFEQFSAKHPVAFGFVITFVFIVMVIVSAILGNLWPGEESYGQPGNILGRLISVVILLILLFHLGWLRSAGLTKLGTLGTWAISVLLLAYSVAILSYALTGKIDPGLFSSELSAPVILFILLAALMEEVVFRGLVLQALVRAWGSAQIGIIKSVLVSSLFFCSIHLFDLLGGRSLSAVFLQSLEAFFLGIMLGALVLSGKSIYPAVLLHGILNLSAYLLIENTGGVEPASTSWLLMSLFMLPLALYGLYLLRGLSLQFAQSNSAMSNEYSGR